MYFLVYQKRQKKRRLAPPLFLLLFHLNLPVHAAQVAIQIPHMVYMVPALSLAQAPRPLVVLHHQLVNRHCLDLPICFPVVFPPGDYNIALLPGKVNYFFRFFQKKFFRRKPQKVVDKSIQLCYNTIAPDGGTGGSEGYG